MIARVETPFAVGFGSGAPPWRLRLRSWAVFRGGWEALTAPQFATLVGDLAMVRRMKDELNAAGVIVGLGMSMGVGGLVGGAAVANYTSKFGSSLSNSAWLARQGVLSALLFTAGAGLLVLAPIIGVSIAIGQQWVGRYYSPAEAEKWTDNFNAEADASSARRPPRFSAYASVGPGGIALSGTF